MSQEGILSIAGGGGGGSPILTLTGNSGGPVPPTANNVNVVGDGTTITIAGNPGTSTLTASLIQAGVTYYSLTPFIVGADVHSQYTTVAAAITAAQAVGGIQNIYVKPGTYAGFSLPTNIRVIGIDETYVQGFSAEANQSTPSVIFSSPVTLTGGDVVLQNIQVSSLVMAASCTGSVIGCQLDTLTTSGTNYEVNFQDTSISTSTTLSNTSTTGCQFSNCFLVSFTVSASVANLEFTYCAFEFSGFSISAGTVVFEYCTFFTYANVPITISGTATCSCSHCHLLTTTTPFVFSGTGLFTHANTTFGTTTTQQNSATVSKLIQGSASNGYTGSDVYNMQNGIHTTDATVTTLASVVVNELESITMWGTVTGAQSDHTNAIGGTFSITARRASGGNVTLVGAANVTVNSSSAATFTANVDTGTQTVRVRFTGVAATTYNTVCQYNYQKVLTNA